MKDNLTAALHTRFGFERFRPGQFEAITHLLNARHTLVVMPTGAGKSLIYQFAALELPGITLVLSPLIALMQDQVDALTRHNIAATYINSALRADEQAHRLEALAGKAFKLVYAAPERLRSVAFQAALRRVNVSLLAVDEAHCISHWGHDFRPDYLHIAAARRRMKDPITAALTATATPQVQSDIMEQLELPTAQRVITGFNRPNLSLEVRYTADLPTKLRALQELLTDPGPEQGAALVYVGARRDAEEVAEFIRSVLRLQAQHYHGGMEPETRTRIQEAFLAGHLPIVVATNAFGMGVDRPDVRLVVHYAAPGTLEAYYQEAGRAGRDGLPARAVLLYAPQDRALQEWFIANDAPTLAEVQNLHDVLLAANADKLWMTAEQLSLLTGLPEIKIRVGLAQLESAGSIQRLGDAASRMLLGIGPWNTGQVQAAAAQVEERRRQRRAQLAQMIAYAESNGCRRRILLDHFGDTDPLPDAARQANRCCDNCQIHRTQPLPGPRTDVADLSRAGRTALIIFDAVRRLPWEIGRRKLAQLLKGSRAREIRQFGYDGNVYYGRLEVFRLREIQELIAQLIQLGHLKVIGGEQPVLRLAPQGQAALKARSSIPLRLPRRVSDKTVERKRAEREAGGTVALTGQLLAQGLTPAEIAARRGLTENTIYNHLAQLIGAGSIPLAAVIPEDVVQQVHAAIAQVGDVTMLAPIKACLAAEGPHEHRADEISYGQIRCVVEAWKRERGIAPERTQSSASERIGWVVEAGEARSVSKVSVLITKEDAIAAFLSRSYARRLDGPWYMGWALDFRSRFTGAAWSRSRVGELAYRLKYQRDRSALAPLVELAAALCTEHPVMVDVDALVPVPPTEPGTFNPVVEMSQALSVRFQKPVWLGLVKTRRTQPQKQMRSLAQKRANVAGAFVVEGNLPGKRLLVLDDLYDSGATLEEVSRVLHEAGAARLRVLTLTRTIHADL